MKSQLILLAELQSIDSRLLKVEAAREAIFSRQRTLQTEVDKLKAEHKSTVDKVEELEKERRQKELEFQTDRDKQRKWEVRLEELKTGREFAALSREVEGLKRSMTESQERVQALSGEIEETRKKAKDVEQKLKAADQALSDEKKSVQDTLKEHEVNIGKERENRGRITTQLPANLVKRYEQLLQKRQGVAVVPAKEGGVCKGCNMGLPPQMFIRVQRGETVEQCPACNRMLYWEPLLARDATLGEART
ncbi:MAG: C4-type zinc ribbon domain-containing protein [Myxococcota bacterium]